jgi:hypothetical protein
MKKETALKTMGVLLTVLLYASFSRAGDMENERSRILPVSAGILTAAANLPHEWISDSGQFLLEGMNRFPVLYSLEIPAGNPDKKGLFHEIGKAVDQASFYFFKHVQIEDRSSKNPETPFELKSRIRNFTDDPRAFELNLSLDIGYHSADNLNIEAVRIESFFYQTFITTVYNYEKKEIELGLSNVMVNKLLLEGMTLELQTDSFISSGALLLSMTL